MTYTDSFKQAEYQRAWLRRRRAEWIAANGPCALCGSWESPEVDHVDPTTKVSHSVWSWSVARRAAELAKCQVLCAACHKAKTANESSHTRFRPAGENREEMSPHMSPEVETSHD